MDCLVNLAYSPVEQSVWVGQVGVIHGIDHARFSVWCTKLWIVLLIVNILKLLRSFRTGCKTGEWRSLLLSLFQDVSDLINAIHFLPSGFLWSSQLPPVVVGLLGMISSTIALYQVL